jgi:hypothetical protein
MQNDLLMEKLPQKAQDQLDKIYVLVLAELQHN